MAEINLFEEIGSQLFSRIFSSILWFGLGAIIFGVVAFLMYYFLVYKKRFDIKVKIRSNRSEDAYSIIFDKAAILTDRKDQTKFFRVWGLKKDFPVPSYRLMQKTNEGDYLEIYRKSENEFYFLLPAKIEKSYLFKSDGKKYPIALQRQIMLDPDMAYWISHRDEKRGKMFSTEHWAMKLMPYIPHLIGGVLTIFMLYILLDNMPQLLKELKGLAEIMQNMQRAEVVTG